MSKYVLKYVILLTIFFLECIKMNNSIDENSDLQFKARQNLIEKEKAYLENKPLSKELTSFISQVKRKSRNIRNIPQKELENFDVEKISKSTQEKLFDIEDFSLPVLKNVQFTSKFLQATSPLSIRDVGAQIHVDPTETTSTPEEITESASSIAESEHIAKEVKVDVDKLIKIKISGLAGRREGALCNLTGYWDTDAGGMQLNITATSTKCKSVIDSIEIIERDPPFQDGFLCDGHWKLSGTIPFDHSSLFILTGEHRENKKVTTFIGECRNCDGIESVTGQWMIGRASRDCKDKEATHIVISDIWRKSHIANLKQSHMDMMAANDTKASVKCRT